MKMTTSLGTSSLWFYFFLPCHGEESVPTSTFPVHYETRALGSNLMNIQFNQLASCPWVFVAQTLLLIAKERLCPWLEEFQKSCRDNGGEVLRGKV